MSILKTSSGTDIILDHEDIAVASEFRWHDWTNRKYNGHSWKCPAASVLINGKKRVLLLHRLLLGATFGDGKIIDHINGNTFDARKQNLRFCSHGQNISNQRNKTKNYKTSRFHGVFRSGGKWRAQIRANKIKIHLGMFINEEDAARAYNSASMKFHGEFASMNTI